MVTQYGIFTEGDRIKVTTLDITGRVLQRGTGGPFTYYSGNLPVYAVLVDETSEVRFFPQGVMRLAEE